MPSSRDPRVITDPRAADFLINPATTPLIKPFLNRESTIKAAAGALGLAPAALYYRVQRMVELGLLEVAHTSARRGKALKVYRSTAPEFFVPFKDTAVENLEDFVRLLNNQWYPRLLRGLAKSWLNDTVSEEPWGLHISKNDAGLLIFDMRHYPDSSDSAFRGKGTVSLWDTDLYLSVDDVEKLGEELQEVLAKYGRKRTGSRQVLHLAIAPWEE